jgi:gamma-tubulin complex component 4
MGISQNLHTLLQTFYEQLSLSTAQQAFGAGGDASKSVVYNYSVANITAGLHTTTFLRPPTTHSTGNTQSKDEDGDVRRHIERLLLRLDYNGGFSNYDTGFSGIDRLQREGILKQGGLA